MKIETKYNIGDKVWAIIGSKFTHGVIRQITVISKEFVTHVVYELREGEEVSERLTFSTKGELVKYMKNTLNKFEKTEI